MKKFVSGLLCMVLLLSMFCVSASAAENTWIEAGVTVSEDGTVTVAVTGKQAASNARLTVEYDAGCLTYAGCRTPFAVHTVKAENGKLTVGLAGSSAKPVKAGEVVLELTFVVNGSWHKTDLQVTAETYAGRKANETVALSVQGQGSRFQDVTAGQWFYEAVEYMASEGYIKGVSEDHFGPSLEMNRASFVTLLGRLDGNADSKAKTDFVDVPYDSFYSGHVAWAVENHITNGVDSTHFAPAEPINRAQMVAFLYRYAKSEGQDVSVGNVQEVLKGYTDGEAVAAISWAAEPFAWAVENGVINGMDGALNPMGTANRAQVAVMLYRFFFED